MHTAPLCTTKQDSTRQKSGSDNQLDEDQVQEIQRAIKEADAGEFANVSEVKRTFAKWG